MSPSFLGEPVAQPRGDHLGVNIRDVWVAGDVVRDRSPTPGLDAAPVEEVLLQSPEHGVREALAFLQDKARFVALAVGHGLFVHHDRIPETGND